MTEADFQERFRQLVRDGHLISEAVSIAREEYHAPPSEKTCPECGRQFYRGTRLLFHWLKLATCGRRCGQRWRRRQERLAA